MVGNPRESSYFRGDGWDGEAVKWYERADAKDKDTAKREIKLCQK